MSLVLTPNILKPSGITAIPNRVIRPAFGIQYGFDVELGLDAPELSLQETGEDEVSYTIVGVLRATNYRVEKSIDGGSYTFVADHATDGTYTDSGNPEGVSIVYRVRSENISFESDWTSASIILKVEFTTAILEHNSNHANATNTFTLRFRPELAFSSGTVTLTGLDASQTASNSSLPITSTNNVLGTAGSWTQSTGTLVLTVASTIPSTIDTVVTFDLTNPATAPDSGSTGITLDATNFTQASISGTFLYTINTTYQIGDTTRNQVTILADFTQPQYTIEQAADTQNILVWDGTAWYIYIDDYTP